MTKQGSNSTAARHFNERRLLTALRRLRAPSKADLARQLHLTQNTIGQIAQRLEQQGLILSSGRRLGRRGQPATLLQLDPSGAYSFGLKFGRQSIDIVLVDFTGAMIKSRHYATMSMSPDDVLKLALRAIKELRRGLPPGRLLGVGAAIPAWMETAWTIAPKAAPKAETNAWSGFDLATRLRSAIDVPLLVENDFAAITVAELFLGHGRTLDDFACIYINSTVGGGLVLDGKYQRGSRGKGAEIGLMPVSYAGGYRPSLVPEPTLLLDRASGSTLMRHLQAHGIAIDHLAALYAAISDHPLLVAEWLQDCVACLLGPLLSIAAVLDLQAIILDGNLPRPVIEALVEKLLPTLAQAAPGSRSPPELRLGLNGSRAAALGAALLPLHSRHGQTSVAETALAQVSPANASESD